MYDAKIMTDVSPNEWNSNLIKSNYSTYFQTLEYLQPNSISEYFPVFIYVVDQNNNVVGQLGIQIIKTSVLYSSPSLRKFLKLISSITTRGIWLYGPIIHSRDKKQRLEILQAILNANNKIIDTYDLVFLEGFSPPLDEFIDESYLKIFLDNGYKITKFVTHITDLTRSVDEIWSKVKKYTKTNVKRASKRGIIIKKLETFEEMKQVVSLHQKWAETKGLKITDYQQEVEELWKKHTSEIEKFFLAFNGNELISAISLSHFNNIAIPTQVLNSYSKSTSLGGPALTWKAITWAKESNMKIYDITGGPLLSDNDSDPDNTLPLTHYKRKWGGEQKIHYNFLKPGKKIKYELYLKMFRILRIYHNLISKTRPSKFSENSE
ncbi:MAG: hypothetical protein HQ490_07270 [Lutibacter sp.]|nr:hypothetical protein [Lutibacter sp.]